MHIRQIIFFAAMALVAGYFFYEVSGIIFSPRLEILEPESGSLLDAAVMHVVGRTRPKLPVWAGGRVLQSDEDGRFEGDLPLSPGYNEIGFYVKDRFGNETRRSLQVFVK